MPTGSFPRAVADLPGGQVGVLEGRIGGRGAVEVEDEAIAGLATRYLRQEIETARLAAADGDLVDLLHDLEPLGGGQGTELIERHVTGPLAVGICEIPGHLIGKYFV